MIQQQEERTSGIFLAFFCDSFLSYVTYFLSQAYMRRFPKCPLIPVFVDSEIISESRSEDGSTLVTERRCVIDVDAPRLLKRVLLL